MLQQITLGGAMIVLPIFLQMTLEYDAMEAGLSLAPLSLSMFAVAHVRRAEVRKTARRAPSSGAGFALTHAGDGRWSIPLVPRADFGWWLIGPLLLAGSGLGLLVSQLNNYTLAPIEEERVSEAAGVNSAAGSFGLSFGLAVAGGSCWRRSRSASRNMTEASTVIPPDQKEQIAQTLEDDAQVMSNTQLDALLKDEPEAVRAEILRINTDARDLSLQIALLVSVLASLIGLLNSFRMSRLPEITPPSSTEGSTVA